MARPRIVPTGQMNGRQGPPGRDGVNAIPADEFIAGRLADPDSDSHAALNGLIAGPSGTALTEVVTGAGGSTGPNLILGSAANRNDSAIADDVAVSVILNPGAGAGNNNVIGGDGSTTVGLANKPTPNATKAGTNASVSLVGGYDNVAGALSSKIIADHSYTECAPDGQTAAGHNAIFGGANHKIRWAAKHAMIAGGLSNDAGGNFAFIGAGQSNVANGAASAALGQFQTLAAAATGALASGASCTINASYGRAHGQLCQVDGNFGTAEGQYAYARNPGQRTISNGRIAATGDAQTSVTHLFAQTTSATETKLRPGTSVVDFTMVRGQSVLVECHFVARTVGGATQGAWVVKTLCAWDAAGASFALGTPVVEQIYSANASLAVRVDPVSSIGAILPKVTGLAATTINWSARMTTTEVVA